MVECLHVSRRDHDVDGVIEASRFSPEIVNAALLSVKLGDGMEGRQIFRFHLEHFVAFIEVECHYLKKVRICIAYYVLKLPIIALLSGRSACTF